VNTTTAIPTAAPPREDFEKNPTVGNRECPKCHYACYPNSGKCTNRECPQYERSSRAMTSDEILREYEPPRLFHGRTWGCWTLDVERMTLVRDAWQEERGDGSGRTTGVPLYVGYFGAYEVDLETIRHSAGMLDWVFQISKKVWADARVTKDLVNAFESIFHPQANLCSGHCHKVIKNPKAFLQNRFQAVAS
jgi:hypothetical protein